MAQTIEKDIQDQMHFTKECVMPDETNENNYLLDSSSFNTLAKDMKSVDILEHAYDYGFRYYKMISQDIELIGYGARKYQKDGTFPKDLQMTEGTKRKQPAFREIIERLHIQNVPELAVLVEKHAVVGYSRVGGAQTQEKQVFNHLISKASQSKPYIQHHDALIGEGAAHYHCVLVVDDCDFRNWYNESITDPTPKAIETKDMIERAKETLKFSVTDSITGGNE